ncbi:hypothetical protein ACWCRF_26735 [Streptomyces sp. NPDC002405]
MAVRRARLAVAYESAANDGTGRAVPILTYDGLLLIHATHSWRTT